MQGMIGHALFYGLIRSRWESIKALARVYRLNRFE